MMMSVMMPDIQHATGVSSLGVPGVPWHPQILADQFTLSQPGGADYAKRISNDTFGFSDLPTALDSNDDNPDDTSHEMTSDDTVMPRGCLEVAQSYKLFLILAVSIHTSIYILAPFKSFKGVAFKTKVFTLLKNVPILSRLASYTNKITYCTLYKQ